MKVRYRTLYYRDRPVPFDSAAASMSAFVGEFGDVRVLDGYYRRRWSDGWNSVEAYYHNGSLHRVDGPAFDHWIRNRSEWWVNGIRLLDANRDNWEEYVTWELLRSQHLKQI